MRALTMAGLLMLLSLTFTCGCSKKGGEGWGDAKKDSTRDVERASKEGADRVEAPVDPAVADAVVGTAKALTKKQEQALPSGVLTAGSFDDNLDPPAFTSFAARIGRQGGAGDLAAKLQGPRLVLVVKDKLGNPVGDARVKVAPTIGQAIEVTTRSDGRAVFALALDRLPADQPLIATATGPDGVGTATDTIPVGSSRWEVTLPGIEARLPKHLDLAVVLDTTGSMGDELEYLKAEIRGISAAIAKRFPEVTQRFALVLYRDDGDEYVVRRFDFTGSLDEFHKRLSDQRAGGGGDYPEAMHRGLEEAGQLRWRDEDAARVLFLVGDAPPHAQHAGRTLAAISALRKRGVAVYPLAASGYDKATEFVMRSAALLTGSQFLFLTDDSGVGGAHAEPTIPYYQVERLERLMIRMITSELAGRRVDPAPNDVLRSVGRRINGS